MFISFLLSLYFLLGFHLVFYILFELLSMFSFNKFRINVTFYNKNILFFFHWILELCSLNILYIHCVLFWIIWLKFVQIFSLPIFYVPILENFLQNRLFFWCWSSIWCFSLVIFTFFFRQRWLSWSFSLVFFLFFCFCSCLTSLSGSSRFIFRLFPSLIIKLIKVLRFFNRT